MVKNKQFGKICILDLLYLICQLDFIEAINRLYRLQRQVIIAFQGDCSCPAVNLTFKAGSCTVFTVNKGAGTSFCQQPDKRYCIKGTDSDTCTDYNCFYPVHLVDLGFGNVLKRYTDKAAVFFNN